MLFEERLRLTYTTIETNGLFGMMVADPNTALKDPTTANSRQT
jgi:hypothetical protein